MTEEKRGGLWFWLKFHWWWYTTYRTRELRDKLCWWIAYNLPKPIAKYAFVRVYTFGNRNTPSYEAALLLTTWDLQQVPAPGCFNERIEEAIGEAFNARESTEK